MSEELRAMYVAQGPPSRRDEMIGHWLAVVLPPADLIREGRALPDGGRVARAC